MNGKALASGSASEGIDLNVGDNEITVEVTAEDTTTVKTYTITVTRYDISNNNSLSGLTVSRGLLNPSFDSGTLEYAVSVTNSVYSIEITPTLADGAATLTVGGEAAKNGNATTVALDVGANVIEIAVTAEDGTTKTYKVTVTRAASSNNNLNSLTTSEGALNPTFNGAISNYEVSVANSVTSLSVTASVYSPHASFTINGVAGVNDQASSPIPLNVGENTIVVKVQAQDGTERQYTIVVTRLESSNANLNSLALNEGTLDPVFAPETFSYEVQVRNRVNRIEVTPTASDPTATITVNGQTVASGATSEAIKLKVGANTIEVMVTAQDGSTHTYTVTVTRGKSSNDDDDNGNGNNGNGQGQTRTVTVTAGADADAYTSTVDIVRKEIDGSEVDEVVFDTAKALEIAEKAQEGQKQIARIIVDELEGDPADEIHVNLPIPSIQTLSDHGMSLEIETPNASIILSKDTLNLLSVDGEDLYFRVVPIRNASDQNEVKDRTIDAREVVEAAQGNRVSPVGLPMTIETNYHSRTTALFFPIEETVDGQGFENGTKRLGVYIEHSDGDTELQFGKLVYDESGQLSGIEITIDKFSTFTILAIEQPGILFERYIYGYEDGTFKPTRSITRAELASILGRSLPEQKSSGMVFPDVKDSHWAYDQIQKVSAAGIMIGGTQGEFRPNAPVKRAELALIVKNWMALVPVEPETTYPDTKGHWASEAIAAVSEANVMKGYEDNTFRPNHFVTRAEAVTVLNQLFDRPSIGSIGSVKWTDVSDSHWAYQNIISASTTFRFNALANGQQDIEIIE